MLTAVQARAGILITRTGTGIQFSEAAVLAVNGKDKVLSLGAQPRLTGPAARLPAVKLGDTLLKDGDTGVMAAYTAQGGPIYTLPQNTPKNAPPDAAGMWQTARITYKKTAADKAAAEVTPQAFVAFLPQGPEGLAAICMDSRALELIGGKGKSFAAQVELLAAAAKAYGSSPAMKAVEKYVERSLQDRYDRFERGGAAVEVLNEGLMLAELSRQTYPGVPEQERLRKSLAERKDWLDRRAAVLRAFVSAGHWDSYLLAYRDFEKYAASFSDLRDNRVRAMKESLQSHRKLGGERMAEGEYRGALKEFRLAASRAPSDPALQQEIAVAWTEYSRRAAVDQREKRKQLSVGQREAVAQALHFASRYKEQNKLEDALKSVGEAEAIDPESLSVLLKKAEVLAAMRETGKALAALDAYDMRAVDEERQPAAQLRNELLFQRTTALKEAQAQAAKAWQEGAFHRTRASAAAGLRVKEDDPNLLYYSGMAALVVRRPAEGRALLSRYLELSDTVDAAAEQRARARAVLAASEPAAPPPEGGEPNWLSGWKAPAGVYYCPLSLAFQARVDHIEASNKLRVSFEWVGPLLKAVVPTFEKNERVTGEKKISFAYEDRVPQVFAVALDEATPAAPGPDPDERFSRSALVLPNNPYADPAAVERLTGVNVTLGLAGNRFFHPFVWEKIHYFRFTYDGNGRVKQARHLADRNGPQDNLLLEFQWDGPRLAAVRGFQLASPDGGKRTQVYERVMQYQDGRLVGEEIRADNRTSRIKYLYNGPRLASANCDKDLTLDGRSRQVTFLSR
ncbi:MAG: hypothetical protein ACE15B_02130 [Bryobacteraceae bacterium]